MTGRLQLELDRETQRHEKKVAELANRCLQDFKDEWKQGSKVRLTFGMGDVLVEVNNLPVDEEDYPEIEQVIMDVCEITDDFRIACPDNLEIN